MTKKSNKIFTLSLLASISFTINVQAAGVDINELYKNAYDSTVNVSIKGKSHGIKGPLNNETQFVINAVEDGMQVDIMDARAKINLLPDSLLQAKRTFSSILDQFQHPVYERSVFLLNQATTSPNQKLLNSVRYLIKDIPTNFKSCYSSAADEIQGQMFKKASDLVDIASKTKNQQDIDNANKYIDELRTNDFVTPEIGNFINTLSNKVYGNVKEGTFQISKLTNIEGAAWINSSEMLTLRKKSEFKNPNSVRQVRDCSIYNINTKTKKDFTNVDIDGFCGVSSDGKYALYTEPKYIPLIGSDEWEKSIESEELFHYSIKLLNLTNGQITSLKTEYNNKDAEYFWVAPDKILVNYHDHWSIVDLAGNVIEKGTFKDNKENSAWISGFDIKANGNSVEGKFYYTIDKPRLGGGSIGVTLCSIDVKTKEINPIFYNENSLSATKKGNSIIIDKYVDNGEISPGVFNRSFGAYSLDEKGNILRDIKFETFNSGMALSPDGSKLAYLEGSTVRHGVVKVKIVDLKTGQIKEIMKSEIINNLQWNADGKSLSFANGDSSWLSPFNTVKNIDTYIINFDN